MSSTIEAERSPSELDLRADLIAASDLDTAFVHDDIRVRLVSGKKNIWFRIALRDVEVAAIRVGANAGEISNVQAHSKPNGEIHVEFTTALGPMRAKLCFFGRTLRCTTSLLPSSDLRLTAASPRDVLLVGDDGGIVFTHQRGLRSGIVFAGRRQPSPFSLFYFQNFSALSDFFRETKQTPNDTVGGSWPEVGFTLPGCPEAKLPKGCEWTLSDAYITIAAEAPSSEEAVAGLYLDLLAETYLALERPAVSYHPWNDRAADALRDLSLSPACTYERQGQRFLMPYVGDQTKPPESMVQFTVAVNLAEYDAWRGEQSALQVRLQDTAGAFYDNEIGSIVRWLPGETFDAAQADDNMSHEAMDSWYVHHSLFNLARFAGEGDVNATTLFRNSLAFVIRVARRFNYRWPIFFNVKTLDVIRAEAEPGAGGETDVAGMYALVMIHAYEMFGTAEYLHEAEIALAALHGFGFRLAYQLNTTGFAAEAAMRMFKITGKPRHLGLAEVCLANLFDNMWLWQCDYDHARHYPTFFGLFPLRDAPYIAPFEELEAHAKFHEFLQLGGDDVRPSLRLLIAEYQKYGLHRCWFYYPDALPVDGIAGKPRNGRVDRALSVPLEDLQDGREASGQVGQEVYGSGMPFVMTARHYANLAKQSLFAYSSYPMYDFCANDDGSASWRAGGDARCEGELRIIPNGIDRQAFRVLVWARDGDDRVALTGATSAEGHAVFTIRGGQTVELECREGDASGSDGAIRIGTLIASEAT